MLAQSAPPRNVRAVPWRVLALSVTERAMIQERVRAGLRRAKDEGKQLGRPKIAADVETAIQAALRRKDRPGVRVIAATHGVSVNTVQRIAHAR